MKTLKKIGLFAFKALVFVLSLGLFRHRGQSILRCEWTGMFQLLVLIIFPVASVAFAATYFVNGYYLPVLIGALPLLVVWVIMVRKPCNEIRGLAGAYGDEPELTLFIILFLVQGLVIVIDLFYVLPVECLGGYNNIVNLFWGWMYSLVRFIGGVIIFLIDIWLYLLGAIILLVIWLYRKYLNLVLFVKITSKDQFFRLANKYKDSDRLNTILKSRLLECNNLTLIGILVATCASNYKFYNELLHSFCDLLREKTAGGFGPDSMACFSPEAQKLLPYFITAGKYNNRTVIIINRFANEMGTVAHQRLEVARRVSIFLTFLGNPEENNKETLNTLAPLLLYKDYIDHPVFKWYLDLLDKAKQEKLLKESEEIELNKIEINQARAEMIEGSIEAMFKLCESYNDKLGFLKAEWEPFGALLAVLSKNGNAISILLPRKMFHYSAAKKQAVWGANEINLFFDLVKIYYDKSFDDQEIEQAQTAIINILFYMSDFIGRANNSEDIATIVMRKRALFGELP